MNEKIEYNEYVKNGVICALRGEGPSDFMGAYRPPKVVLFGCDMPTINIPSFLRIAAIGVTGGTGLKRIKPEYHTKIGGIGKKQWFGTRIPIYDYEFTTTAIYGILDFLFFVGSSEEREVVLQIFRDIEDEYGENMERKNGNVGNRTKNKEA
ncbi:MAG: hypothetical protein JJE19_02720 [Methanosarcinales archaeon]|nr:hypothetical protein [Methanosarcinales archaeon]